VFIAVSAMKRKFETGLLLKQGTAARRFRDLDGLLQECAGKRARSFQNARDWCVTVTTVMTVFSRE
jgi:hypothetical protein